MPLNIKQAQNQKPLPTCQIFSNQRRRAAHWTVLIIKNFHLKKYLFLWIYVERNISTQRHYLRMQKWIIFQQQLRHNKRLINIPSFSHFELRHVLYLQFASWPDSYARVDEIARLPIVTWQPLLRRVESTIWATAQISA